MEKTELHKHKSFYYLNSLLIFSFFFLSYVIEQENELSARRLMYLLLLLSDIIGIVCLNQNFFLFQKIKELFGELYSKFVKKQEQRASRDDIKEFIDQAVEDNFKKCFTSPDEQSQFKSHGRNWSYCTREKEILGSTAKIDERFMSNKVRSPNLGYTEHKAGDTYPFSTKGSMFTFNPLNAVNSVSTVHELSIPNQGPSYRALKSLQLSNKYPKKLKVGDEVSKEDLENDINRFKLHNCDKWMENFKLFLLNNFIQTIIEDHEENIDHLNNLMESSLNVQIVQTMIEDDDFEVTSQELANQIMETNMQFGVGERNMKNNYMKSQMKRGLQVGPIELCGGREKDESGMHRRIFFGDNGKLSYIANLVEQKLRTSKAQKERVNFEKNVMRKLFTRPGSEKITDSSKYGKTAQFPNDESDRQCLHNPFLIKSKHTISDYEDMIANHNMNMEENLRLLKKLLDYRLFLNEKLSTFFIKEENDKHEQLILEYNIWRLKELKRTDLSNYKNISGGNFFEESWISAFPSDSQLVASIAIKYLEDVYRENEITKAFLVNWPLSPRMEQNSCSLVLFQINPPGCEPHFNLVYEDNMINCIADITKKLKLEEFVSMIIKPL